MLDNDVVKIAEDRIQLEITEQTEAMHREIKAIKARASAAGMLGSGNTFLQIKDLCTLNMKARAQMAWLTYSRFLTTAGITYTDTLANELKSLVAKHLPEGMFSNLVQQNAELTGRPSRFSSADLEQPRKNALRKIGTDIDLFVRSLKTKAEIKEKESPIFFQNFYAPIGAIQTGDSSIANVTQTIDPEIKGRLITVLEEISLKLVQPDVTIQFPKKDIIDIVEEGREEISKQSPNVTKLKTLLATIATAIQTTASLKPAYESLKLALTFFGVTLP